MCLHVRPLVAFLSHLACFSQLAITRLQEYLFRGIQKSEWQNLFSFIQSKRLRIENLREAELGPAGGGAAALDLGDDIDNGAQALSVCLAPEMTLAW